MIWTYIISIVFAITWFVIFRYLAVKNYHKSEYEHIIISKGMIMLSIIALLIPILNILYFVIAPIVYLCHLEEEYYGIRLQSREGDAFSEAIKNWISWLKEGAF